MLAEDPQAAEDKDEYLAENIFWVPKQARWSHLQANAKQSSIGTLIDDALRAIEKDNESLKGVLPKDYARPALNKVMLGELIDLISGIALNDKGGKPKDVLGRVYEYFRPVRRRRRQARRRVLHTAQRGAHPGGDD